MKRVHTFHAHIQKQTWKMHPSAQSLASDTACCKKKKKKRKSVRLHADPKGYELHAEAVVGSGTLVD